MKEIKLKISDSVFNELKTTTIVRHLCDNAYSVGDSVIKKILLAIEDGKAEVTIQFKSEIKDKK